MIKKFMFAMIPMVMLAGSAIGNDDLLSKIGSLDLDSIGTASADIEDFDLASVDVDGVLNADGEEQEEDAIAACFRRIGYGYRSYGYRSYGYRSYGYGYGCYRPYSYSSYSYYRPLYCYRPVTYSCYTPCYSSYWGCY